jgi:hypothetical protein
VVPEVVAPARLQWANAILRLGTNAARISGFAVAGGLVALVGPGWALLVDAATFAVSGVLLAALRLPGTVGNHHAAHHPGSGAVAGQLLRLVGLAPARACSGRSACSPRVRSPRTQGPTRTQSPAGTQGPAGIRSPGR